MPLYEYECEACGRRFERIQKFSDPPVESCPVCEGRVRKLLSSPAIQFKGSGWYVTDYAQKGRAESAAKDEAAKTSDSKTPSDSGKSAPSSESSATTTASTDSAGSSTKQS